MIALLLLFVRLTLAFSLSRDSDYFIILQRPHKATPDILLAKLFATPSGFSVESLQLSSTFENGDYCVSLSQNSPANVVVPCFNIQRFDQFPVQGVLTVGDGVSFLREPAEKSSVPIRLAIDASIPISGPIVTEAEPEIQEYAQQEGDLKAAPTSQEPVKGFFQKYWMYILPIAIVVLFTPSGQQQQ